MKLTITEQAAIAVSSVNNMFIKEDSPIPEGATLESLWEEICRLKGKSRKPKKVDAVRMLLEDERLTGLTIPLLADIIKRVFHKHGLACDTSDASVRWYISQKTLEWNIQPRDKRGPGFDLEL